MIDVRRVADATDLEAAYAIRHEVFVLEQSVPAELELDEYDATAEHVLATVDGRAVGTGRLVVEPGDVAHLGRLAVRREARGTGVGAALVAALEDVGRARHLRTAVLGAQTHAVDFYERHGYTAYGAEFDDAGIPHRWMRKRL